MNPQDERGDQQTTVRPSLESVIENIAEDSRQEPGQYLQDTLVPNGGE